MIKNYSEFLSYCHSLDGEKLFTIPRKSEFIVKIENNSLFFVPKSSGKARKADDKVTQEVLDFFNKYNDWMQANYKSITFNASYILAILKHEKNS